MTPTQLIKDQIELVKNQTDGFIEKIDQSKWHIAPETLDTNMNWQIGHIILANYLHGISSISGASEQVRKRINVKDFVKFYGPKSSPAAFLDEKPNTVELLELYDFIFELINTELDKVEEADLHEQTAIPNPGAKTKYEALTLLFKHQSWHNGQIAMLHRVLSN
jgi:uncharacterized damage-inducible protein DinB